MAEQVRVSIEINATPETVYSMVSDLPRMSEWSPENDSATWLKGASSATIGARFKGSNSHESKRWSTTGTIIEATSPRVLAFRITAGFIKVAVWRYSIEQTPSGCTVTETWIDERNRLTKALGKPISGIADRAEHNRSGM
jgi:uncharacterized protein YndB with AHSA1/START domain